MVSQKGHITLKTFFKNIFGGNQCFLWGHWYPCFGLLVTSALGFKSFVPCVHWIPHINLWCDTCWPLGGRAVFDSHTCTFTASKNEGSSWRIYLKCKILTSFSLSSSFMARFTSRFVSGDSGVSSFNSSSSNSESSPSNVVSTYCLFPAKQMIEIYHIFYSIEQSWNDLLMVNVSNTCNS